MAAKSDGIFHVALHRQVDSLRRDASIAQRVGGKAHHDFRPANHCDGVGRIKAHARNERRHDPDIAAPAVVGMIDGDLDLDFEAFAPLLDFMTVDRMPAGLRIPISITTRR